MFLTLVDLPEK